MPVPHVKLKQKKKPKKATNRIYFSREKINPSFLSLWLEQNKGA